MILSLVFRTFSVFLVSVFGNYSVILLAIFRTFPELGGCVQGLGWRIHSSSHFHIGIMQTPSSMLSSSYVMMRHFQSWCVLA